LRELEPVRLTRVYVFVLGVGLLLDGALLLVLGGLGVQVSGINTSDVRHNVLHVVWGVALLAVSYFARGGHELRAVWAALIFGAFYVSLGVVGLTVEQPFGLQLGPGENAFHLIVGPLALALGAWSLRTWSPPPVPLRTATQPVALRSVPATRRRSRRRPGKVRGHQRRH
jgi:hypothetical protein